MRVAAVVTREIFAVAVLLPEEAVMVTVWPVENVPAVAAKEAVVLFTGTVTDAGTVNAEELSVMVTGVFVAVAGVEIVTMHRVAVFAEREDVAHCKELMVTGVRRVIAAL